MTMLKDLLDDVADQAKLYDPSDRALAVVRRRRRIARTAPLVLAAAVAIGLAAVSLPLHRSSVDGDAAATVDWLPQRVAVPEKSPPPLPNDHGVAPGSVVYQKAGYKTVLVTEDGRQYQLPRAWTGYVRGLSPDGRWLVVATEDKVLLRDLSGTDQIELAGGSAGVGKQFSWSPDGRWLALWTAKVANNTEEPDADPRITTLDLDSRKQQTVPISGSVMLTGVLDTGDVVVEDRISPDQVTTSTPVRLSILDRETGRVRDRYQIDVTPWLSAKERQARQPAGQPFTLLPSVDGLLADGHTVLLRPVFQLPKTGDGVGYVPDDVLAVDLETGKMTRRYHLPDPRIAKSTKDWIIDHNRTLRSVLPDGLLYVHNGRTNPPGGPIALELLDLSTGKLQVVSTVSAEVTNIVALRGGTG
jgi:WD40-like Beta Propeller Repeat